MDWFEEQIEAARRTGSSSLNLSGIGLASLPGSLQSLTALARLDLGRNQLTALPEWLGNLTALTRLDLWGNQLTALPESLGNLTALTRRWHILKTHSGWTVTRHDRGWQWTSPTGRTYTTQPYDYRYDL